mgnify:CR=1 FL=1
MSKTNLEEINRNIYDIKNKDEYDFKIKKGLTREIIEEISKQKNDPDWMREFRLKALEVYNTQMGEKDALEAAKAELKASYDALVVRGDLKALDQEIKDIEKLSKDDYTEESYKAFKTYDIGDIIGITGFVFKTRTEEISVHAKEVTLLSKSLRPLPEKFHGLKDPDLRYRQRYVDLISNEESRQVFLGRSKLYAFIHKFLGENGFLEVETPILQTAVCGAAAKPFYTHHNALDIDCNLRIAPETYLKQCVAAGYDRVYEIAKCFRNEGMDTQHLQEFTQVEWYASYWNFEDNVKFYQKFIKSLLMELVGTTQIEYQGVTLDFGKDSWDKINYVEEMRKIFGFDFLEVEDPKELKDKNQYELYENIELPVTRILGEMEFAGTEIDLDVLKEMDTAFDETIEKLANDIYRISGTTFNISSPKQLGQVLFEDLGLKGGKKTKTGYSTSQDVLEKIIDAHPVVPLVLEYRMLTKLSSTYLKGLQEQVFPDNKIHTIYKQTLTHTGRLSSVDPNLQNIPVRSEEGKLIRKAFVSHNGYLVSFDYSQIELRILAHMAHVTNLIDAFNQGKDIHRHTAALVFGVKDEEVTPQMRSQAKAVNFGIIYGMSEFRLSKDIGMSISEARDFINKYFETYPEVKTYMDEVVETCKKQGYVSTLLNRKRYIPTINDKNFMVRQQAQRYAMNTPIQGTGADILKLAMIEVDKALKEKNLKSQMILQVHDELIFDVFEDELEEVMSLVKEKMENCIKMDVPLIVEGNYAKNWCELK